MATAEKESLLKNMKIKIKSPEEQKSSNSKNRYNISGSNEMKERDKDSSKVSGEENKEIINLNIVSQDKNSNSNNSVNSKVIKENPEEVENNKNDESKSSENIESSEKKSSEKSSEHEEEKNNSENNNSSFLNSKNYNIANKEDQNEDENYEENEDKHYLNRKDPFMTTGKFMQIQPHFNLFNKRIDILREGIYDNTKKCLMCKSSLQMSENLMRERANSIVRDFVEKLYNLKELFMSSNTDADNIMNETRKGIMNLENVQKINKNEIKDCDYRLNRCERQIGNKLLGKPNYSFMKRVCNTTFNKK